MPCVRKIRRAYSKPEHDDRTLVNILCSAADKRLLMMTVKTFYPLVSLIELWRLMCCVETSYLQLDIIKCTIT